MKKILFLLSVLFVSSGVYAQKILYLKPFIGAQNAFTGYGEGSGQTEFLQTNGIHPTDNYGLLLEMPLNPELTLSAGWYKGDIGWSFEQSFPSKTDPELRGGVIWYPTTTLHKFPVTVKKRIGEVGWQPVETEGVRYKNAIRFYALGGLSVDLLPGGKSLSDSVTTPWGFSSGDYLINHEKVTVLSAWGTSAVVGLGTQLFHKGKPRLDLTFFYSQGLRKILQIDLVSDLNGQQTFTRIYSRGTVAGIMLGYPIRLKTFRKNVETPHP